MNSNRDFNLVSQATNNDKNARQEIVKIIDPMIIRQNNRFCRKYCYEQNFHYQCTLRPPLNGAPKDAPLCEWGNAGYAWMLSELINNNRLKTFQAKDGASLKDYWFVILNSLPFFERWKDWRFGNRVYVPEYITTLHPKAGKIFRALRRQLNSDEIAHETGLNKNEVREISNSIIRQLLVRGRMHLLSAAKEVSYDELSEQDDNLALANQDNVFDFNHQQTRAVKNAFTQLNPVEQHVLTGFFIEELPAKRILQSLQHVDWPLSDNTAREIENIQQLYYFRRKAIKKLHQLFQRALDHPGSKQ